MCQRETETHHSRPPTNDHGYIQACYHFKLHVDLGQWQLPSGLEAANNSAQAADGSSWRWRWQWQEARRDGRRPRAGGYEYEYGHFI